MSEPARVVKIDGKTHSFPSDFTDEEISAALGAIPVAAATTPKARTWTDTAMSALPVVGGVVGAVAGGPFGAALGAAGGEAWRQNINRMRGADAPTSSSEAALDIAKEGAISGALVGGGKLVGVGAKAAARPIINATMKAAGAVNPDLVGLASPRAGNAVRMAQTMSEMLKQTQAANASKLTLSAADVVKVRQLMDVGMSQTQALEALKAIAKARP